MITLGDILKVLMTLGTRRRHVIEGESCILLSNNKSFLKKKYKNKISLFQKLCIGAIKTLFD